MVLSSFWESLKTLSKAKYLTRNVKTICMSELLNDVGHSGFNPSLPVFYTLLGATPLQYGFIEGISSLFGIAFTAPAGELADRIGRRKPIYAGFLMMALSRFLVALSTSFWLLMPFRFLNRFGRSVRYAARDPLLAESVTPETRGMAYAVYQLMDNMGSFIGPILTIVILDKVGQTLGSIRNIFLLASVPTFIAALLSYLYITDTLKDKRRSMKERISFLTKVRRLVNNKNLLRFTGVTCLFTPLGPDYKFAILYATHGPLKVSLIMTTLLYFVHEAVSVIASLPAGRLVDRVGKKFTISLSIILYTSGMLTVVISFYFLTNIFVLAIAFAFLGLYDTFFSVSRRPFVADSASLEDRGMVMAAYSTLHGVCSESIAPIIAGFLFFAVSPVAPFVTALVVSIIATFLLTWLVSEPRRVV